MQETSEKPIYELLRPDTVQVDLPGESKEEIINNMLELIKEHPAVDDLEAVRKAVWQREEVMSTGVGKGLGLPHAKTGAVSRTVAAFGITKEPVDFDAIDDKPVQLVFLLVGRENAKSQHIRILSHVSRLMNQQSFRSKLIDSENADDVLKLFRMVDEDR